MNESRPSKSRKHGKTIDYMAVTAHSYLFAKPDMNSIKLDATCANCSEQYNSSLETSCILSTSMCIIGQDEIDRSVHPTF
jgi:hypothetical protein